RPRQLLQASGGRGPAAGRPPGAGAVPGVPRPGPRAGGVMPGLAGLALSTLRARKGGFAAALLALFLAAALVSACGTLLQTGLRGGTPTERYAGTPLLVAADQDLHLVKHKKGRTKVKTKPLAERAWLDAGVADRVRAVPGVRDVVPELTFPAYLTGPGGPVAGPHGS